MQSYGQRKQAEGSWSVRNCFFFNPDFTVLTAVHWWWSEAGIKPIWDNLLKPAISDPGGGASTCSQKAEEGFWSPDTAAPPPPLLSKPNSLLHKTTSKGSTTAAISTLVCWLSLHIDDLQLDICMCKSYCLHGMISLSWHTGAYFQCWSLSKLGNIALSFDTHTQV